MADATDLAGSPPIGTGRTKHMAIACLFFRLHYHWHHNVMAQKLYINGKKWMDLKGSSKR